MILGTSYKNERGVIIPTDQVELTENGPVCKATGEKLVEFPAKMSKSLRNVVNPDDVIRSYGADSMRLYEMFMGPLEAVKPWSTRGVEGVFRFLKRVWRMIAETPVCDDKLTKEQAKVLHATIKKVTEDTDTLNFNTAISQMMIFVNEFSKCEKMPREAAEAFVKLISPVCAAYCRRTVGDPRQQGAGLSCRLAEIFGGGLQENEIEILIRSTAGRASAW